MEVHDAILTRRARRVIDDKKPLSEADVDSLVEAMRLAPSCFNNQPWRSMFVYGPETLPQIKTALSKGNEWAFKAQLIVVVAAKAPDDCVIGDRQYFLFDCGLAVGELVLQATEMGMIAHPIAGFSPKKAREILGIPDEYTVITFIICGYPGTDDSVLSDKQKADEATRPARKPIEENFYKDKWGAPLR
jgi:nitroreductase